MFQLEQQNFCSLSLRWRILLPFLFGLGDFILSSVFPPFTGFICRLKTVKRTMSLTPDQFRKVGLGVTPSPSPFLTPRPERRRADLRGPDWNASRQDRDKEVNVQVLLRCRPLNEEEQKMNVPKVISCNDSRREVTVLQSFTSKQVDKVFTFDKVTFCPHFDSVSSKYLCIIMLIKF